MTVLVRSWSLVKIWYTEINQKKIGAVAFSILWGCVKRRMNVALRCVEYVDCSGNTRGLLLQISNVNIKIISFSLLFLQAKHQCNLPDWFWNVPFLSASSIARASTDLKLAFRVKWCCLRNLVKNRLVNKISTTNSL